LQGVSGSQRRVAFHPGLNRGIGSACTLVAEALLGGDWDPSADQLAAAAPPPPSHDAGDAGSAPAAALDSGLASVLLGVVLLDTLNLSPEAGKTTPRDAAVVSALRAIAAGVHSDALFGALLSLRTDPAWWRALTPMQALGYDFKEFVAARAAAGGRSGGTKPVAGA
jgi:inorganic pyrophosphatase/exopolyphosphatase